MDNAETLGSGAKFAADVLKTSTSEERAAYGEGKIMTREQAFDLGSRTLSYAAARDPYSGGNFHRVNIQGLDVEHRRSNSLGSYVAHFGVIDSFGDIDRRSLFLLYVWPYSVGRMQIWKTCLELFGLMVRWFGMIFKRITFWQEGSRISLHRRQPGSRSWSY